jgi:hypothetical protein
VVAVEGGGSVGSSWLSGAAGPAAKWCTSRGVVVLSWRGMGGFGGLSGKSGGWW